ncbi:hypothetical protein MUO66_01150 [Candidatus Bathyarchaeota archaeon]|nr:hypothetical protein [Candidatus Bathyarchaeota archaeon]
MSSKKLIFLCIFLVGIILFLYGASFYNAVVGWLGVYFLLGGLLVILILYVYDGLFHVKQNQKL